MQNSNADNGDFFPPTAWTRVARAGKIQTAEVQDARRTLIEKYDRPLARLFHARLRHRPVDAEDWKQDFVLSHFLTGKIFEHAKPSGRFRNYLARAVRNYIINQLEAESARCRQITNAVAFSQISTGDKSLADSLADPLSLDEDEHLLTHERARDCVECARAGVLQWAQQTGEVKVIAIAEVLARGEIDLKGRQKAESPQGIVITKFMELLRKSVRDEVLAESGQDEEEVIGREAKLLMDALRVRPRLGEF